MKIIETRLNEKSFLDRLACYCREQTRGDKGYHDQDTFVFSRKEEKFWIGRHMAHKGKSDGYANERINGTYHVNDHGHVVVSYRVGKHPFILASHTVVFLLGLIPVAGLLTDAMRANSMSWYGGICGLLFIGFGLSGFFNSPKEINTLEEHLAYGAFGKDLDGKDENGNIRPYGLGHFFIAIDTEHFLGEAVCRKKAGDILRAVRASKKAPGAERIYTAGEKEYEIWLSRRDSGVPINESVQAEMVEVRDRLGLDKYKFPWEK